MGSEQAPKILVAIDPSKRPEDPLALGIRLARLASAPLEVVTVFLKAPFLQEDDLLRQIRGEAEAGLRDVISDIVGLAAADARVVEATSTARALQQLCEDPEVGVVVIGS